MAFQKKIWKGRKSEYPSCRKLIKADGSAELVTLARAEGQVTQEGDAFSPENMNGLEDRIEAGFAELKTVAPSETTPKAAGTAATGTEETFARGDHVHPKQTSVTGNAGTATKLATARTIDGVSFNGSAAITHYGTCSTAAATAAKVVACTGFTLVTGATIRVKFTVTNSAANPTLNVNSTGAKAIYYRGAAITAGYLAANRTYEFVYNGTQYEFVGDIDTNTNTTYSNMTAATASAAGKAGLVPAPAAGAQAKILKGNATWDSVENLTTTFTQATTRSNIATGETLKISLGKIAKWFADLANGAASTLLSSNLTVNRALISNGSGKVAASAVTSTELGHLEGLENNVQIQINDLNTNFENLNVSGTQQMIFTFSNKATAAALYISNTNYLPKGLNYNIKEAAFVGSTGNFASQLTVERNGNYIYLRATNSAFAGLTVSCVGTVSKS